MPELYQPEHEIVCGATGTGKSYWVMYKMLKYLEYNLPFCYIDPKGDGYWKMLALLALTPQGQKLWQERKHRILFVNPVSKSDYLLSFNAIEPLEGEFKQANPDRIALVANNLTSHIRRTSGYEANEAMRMQNFLAAGIATLVQGGGGKHTIAEFPWLFEPYKPADGRSPYNPFTSSLLPQVRHYGTNFFWKTEWPLMLANDRREWAQSSLGRIFPYVFDERCLWTTCSSENAKLDFREVVEKGYFVFVNIPYYFEDDPVTTLIGNIIITKLYYAALQRANPSHYRIILDEARFFNTGPIDRILETGRFKKLWLTLIVQSLNQMARLREGRIDYLLRDTAVNNVRYWSVFNDMDPDDVKLLAWMMFRMRGDVVRGYLADGRPDYLPVAVEQDDNCRRLMDLSHRNVILFDKLRAFKTYAWETPNVPVNGLDEDSQARVVEFEAEQLIKKGAPAYRIKEEIEKRQAEIAAMFSVGQSGSPAGPPLPSAVYRR